MKKIIALIVAAATLSVSMAADTIFSSNEFKTAAPVLLKGTLKTTDWYKDVPECAFEKAKSTYQVYMAFCQPCINCITCTDDTKVLTNAVLYIVEKDSKNKAAYVTKMAIGNQAVSFTKKDGAKKGEVAISLAAAAQAKYGAIAAIQLIGDWNQKTWFSGNDTDSGNAKVAAILSMVRTLNGDVSAAGGATVDFAAGELALRRDDSFTKKMMLEMTVDSAGNSPTNPFLNCGPVVIPVPDTCVAVMTTLDVTTGLTMVENYISKTIPKSYTVTGL